MNVLVLGTGNIEQVLIDLCKRSKFLDHLYTASSEPLEEIPNIEYLNYEDLVHKAKVVQADIILVADKRLIQDGIVEILKKNKLNVVSVSKKWFNLQNSRIVAKHLMNYYSINTPQIIKAPKTFPLVVKTNVPYSTKIAHTMDELIKYREEMAGNQVFLEEFLNGEIHYLLSLWDGKTLIHFKSVFDFTEVQDDRLDLYKTKLNIMFSEEKPEFIGFFISKLIWAKNDWYVLEYIMHLDRVFDMNIIKQDFLFILNSAIYQRLDEFNL